MTLDDFIVSGRRGWAFFDNEAKPTYRSILGRRVADGGSIAVWGMLNPSMAGADRDDPTIRRVIGFTKAMGKSIALVVNVSDYIATKPKNLVAANAPTSGVWEHFIALASQRADLFICGWGANGTKVPVRVNEFLYAVRNNFRGELSCLRMTKGGQPEHPLMLPSSLRPIAFPGIQ